MESSPAETAPAEPKMANQSASDTDYPVQIEISYPESQSRLLALLSIPFFLIRLLLLIPHLIVLYILGIAALLAAWLNFWVILFTGHSSKGLHSYIVGYSRWSLRVNANMYGLTDKYPPFRLKP